VGGHQADISVRGECVIFTCVHVRVWGGECGKEVWWCVSGLHVQKM